MARCLHARQSVPRTTSVNRADPPAPDPAGMPDTAATARTVAAMSRRTFSILVGITTAMVVGVVVAVSAAQMTGSSTTDQSPDVQAPDAVLAPPADQVPAVVALRNDLLVITHEAPQASTEFGPGTLTVAIPTVGVFRFIDSAAPANGGRVGPSDAPLGKVPANLPVVVSYDTADGPRSIYAKLTTAPQVDGDVVRYTLTIFDAPGKGSTYTVSGRFDIPEMLQNVRLMIAGQRLE